MKSSLSNVRAILDEHHSICNLYIMISLANMYEGLCTILSQFTIHSGQLGTWICHKSKLISLKIIQLIAIKDL